VGYGSIKNHSGSKENYIKYYMKRIGKEGRKEGGKEGEREREGRREGISYNHIHIFT
jgi:hypothetical protein